MASKVESILMNPSWNMAQQTFFKRLRDALPVFVSYLESEIPVLDNTTTEQLVDEVGLIKQVKKHCEKVEKTHAERLKARLGGEDTRGSAFQATFRGGTRVILDQGACKALISTCDAVGFDLGKLLKALENGYEIPEEFRLGEEQKNYGDFFKESEGGMSLYVDPLV